MPFICPNLRSVEERAVAGDGGCVALIRASVPGLRGAASSGWRQGAAVLGEQRIARGTAIASFENGRYVNRARLDRAAIFLAYAGAGIWVLEQRADDVGATVQRRLIPSQIAATLSVIELHA